LTVLSWYFYNASPNEKDLGPIFFFKLSYWLPNRSKIDQLTPEIDANGDSDVKDEAEGVNNSNSSLKVINLRKKFGLFKPFFAVDGITFGIQSGEVLALLGHNGAGKTTTINILTGTLNPTSGDAVIFGSSLNYSLPKIQQLIGLCPQHNALWDELSPRQHLKLFCYLKGVPSSQIDSEVTERLKDVLLSDVIDKEAGKFSGGMKRRLSVAVAAIGNPKIMFLDEPTTGLDPMSRRVVWGTIQKLKKGKVVILTTHSMEEADLLGDRIAIMANGKIKCIGTSLHLKNKFGLGYRLNFSSKQGESNAVKEAVQAKIPEVVLLFESGNNITYGISGSKLEKLVELSNWMETAKPECVLQWSISQTTLEEVFFKVSGIDVEHDKK